MKKYTFRVYQHPSWKRLLLLLFLFTALVSSAQVRLFLISDTHVMSPKLLVKDGKAWQNYLAGDRKMEDKSAEMFNALIDTVLKEKPAAVLISGDLTKDGSKLSHEYVVSKLDTLLKARIPTFVVPGNHDLGTPNAVYFDGDSTKKAEIIYAAEFANLYRDFGYDSLSVRDLYSLSYIRPLCKGVKLLGIDSNTGQISNSTLKWLCDQVVQAKKEGYQVIAMMHHPLMEHITGINHFLPTSVIKNDTTVRARLMESGVHLILTGHFHTSDIGKDYNTNKTDSIYDINTGSTITYPCYFRELTISSDLSHIDVITRNLTRIGSCADLKAYSKKRITDYILNHIKSVARSRLGIPPSLIPSSIVKAVADAYIVHSDGNENLQDTKSLFQSLKIPMMFSSSVRTVIKSMLGNITMYGTDHANVTNDLRLTIPLR
ncbi:metallophosphoesterase [Prevotella cerevisiae]|uniref:Metallophosphoesterase n=1 Tax=Segatella cerevisiae TaxID=2053716 RepID=A0ABT1C138_9BACT|nr:metallophosphoesterase [Segatella cerevisiae]MCO6026432.1 metallophosphoesterase [Segatella cerevisiae]